MENIFVEFLPPWIETGLQPAFYDKESGTVLQQTARMYARVNMLIRMFNKLSKNTKTTVEDYINQFNELHDYVHDYFDNLDVQEEINNKLDAMVEAGTLQEIMADYLNASALWCYDTVADMVQATNLIAGSFAKTLGHYSKEDGLGAYYKIDTTGEIELDNGLYASVVTNPGGNNYYDEITTYAQRLNSTWCYITTIPYHDTNDEEIPFSVNLANQTPSEYAQDNNTTLTINGVAWINSTHEYGSVISDGEIIASEDLSDIPDCYYYLGIKPNREMVSIQANQYSAEGLLAQGCEQAFMCYWQLIVNGAKADFDEIGSQLLDGGSVVTSSHPRQCIGQKADKTIVILTCDGRTPLDKGLTSDECATILLNQGCVNAWNMDGGGSATTVFKGYKVNKSVDNNGLNERLHRYTINTKRQIVDKELADAYSNTGRSVNAVYNKLLPKIQQSLIRQSDASTLDSKVDNQSLLLMTHTQDTPVSSINAFYTNTIPHPDPVFRGLYAGQELLGRDKSKCYHRSLVNGVYTPWYPDLGLCYAVKSFLPASQELTADQTYEAMKFTVASANIDNYLTKGELDEDGYFDSFTITCEDTDYFEASITAVVTAASTGVKYMRLEFDDAQFTDSIVQQTIEAGKTGILSCTTLIDTSLKNKSIKLKVYGSTGDKITRPKVILKQVR